MNHRIARLLFGFGVGILAAFFAYKWISDPAPRAERQLEEAVVMAARQQLTSTLASGDVELVDPLATNRRAGKSYVYRGDGGWEVSGFYRREEGDRWHPFLMKLDASLLLVHLKVQDKEFAERAATDAMLEVLP
jgi:hypothetical protein